MVKPGQRDGHQHHQQHDAQGHGQIVDKHRRDALQRHRSPENAAVLAPHSGIVGLLSQGLRLAGGFPKAALPGFYHLSAALMVFHAGCIGTGVKEHLAVLIDQGKSGIPCRFFGSFQISQRIVGKFQTVPYHLGLGAQLLLHLLFVDIVKAHRRQHGRQKHRHSADQDETLDDILFHITPPRAGHSRWDTLYPTPRTVLMMEPPAPSFCRRVLMCISTVRVSPSNSVPQTKRMMLSRDRTISALIIR